MTLMCISALSDADAIRLSVVISNASVCDRTDSLSLPLAIPIYLPLNWETRAWRGAVQFHFVAVNITFKREMLISESVRSRCKKKKKTRDISLS